MTSCGLWVSRTRLWASVVDCDGRHITTLSAHRGDDERWDLLAQIDACHGLDCTLVLTDAQLRMDNVADLALERKMTVLVAPWQLADAVRIVAGLKTGPPRRSAAMLARWVLSPQLRAQLRRPQRDQRQLSLL
jgi:hypothetical protein